MKQAEDTQCSGLMCRRSFLQNVLVTGAVVLGLGAAPVALSLGAGSRRVPVGPDPDVARSDARGESPGVPAVEVAAGTVPVITAAKCVGCTKCVPIAPRTFAMDAKTEKAYVKNPTGNDVATIRRAVKACPTAAITLK